MKQKQVDFFFEFENFETGKIESIGVHSLILTAKSEVFSTMIHGVFKETSPVRIVDATFKSFLNFVR